MTTWKVCAFKNPFVTPQDYLSAKSLFKLVKNLWPVTAPASLYTDIG